MRQRLRRHAAEGHNIQSAMDMKEALDKDGGLRSIQSAVVSQQPISANMPKWTGVQLLYNFRFFKRNTVDIIFCKYLLTLRVKKMPWSPATDGVGPNLPLI